MKDLQEFISRVPHERKKGGCIYQPRSPDLRCCWLRL